jgi:glycosyltransferase involved in cell wall biosynthesis
MRIGIDARFLTHPQRGGFKTYTVNLVKALSLIDSVNSYVLYLDRPPAEVTLPGSGNFAYQVVNSALPVLGMPAREQIALRRRLVHDNLDIMHFLCNTAPVGVPGKFVVTLHDTIQVTSLQPFEYSRGLSACRRWAISVYSRWAILQTAKSASRIITVSHYEKKQIKEHLGIAPERICVTHLAANPVFVPATQQTKREWRFRAQQEFGIRCPFIFAVGYEPRKNINLVIEAFSRLASDYPDIGLVIVAAEGQSRGFFQQLVNERSVTERVVVLGSVSADDLAMLYNLAEAFVFPSRRESFGLPPLEAIACGAPVIAMNMTSLPEVLQDGAMLVEGNDVQTWADAIVQVITDDSLRSSLASRAIRRAAEFSWQRCARETIRIYRDVVEET